MKSTVHVFHDAFLQNGGAENVAGLWAQSFGAELTVLAKSKRATNQAGHKINVIFRWIRTQKSLELLYPFLPFAYLFIRAKKDEIRLVSTTGIAHQIPGRWGKRVLYVHSPARWIWDKESFDMGRSGVQILAANLLRGLFKIYDRKCIREGDVILVNSNATRQKVFDAYSRDAQVLFPPVAQRSKKPKEIQLPREFNKFFLHVGRVRGYKGFEFLFDAFNSSGHKLVLVGEATEKFKTASILGLGFVSDPELQWLYEKAQGLIAVSREDFGLTPVEAASYGCPTIAFRHLGYLDSVKEGVTGEYVIPNDLEDFTRIINSHNKARYSKIEMLRFANHFSPDTHIENLRRFI